MRVVVPLSFFLLLLGACDESRAVPSDGTDAGDTIEADAGAEGASAIDGGDTSPTDAGDAGVSPDASPRTVTIASPVDGARVVGSRTITVTGTLASVGTVTSVRIAVGAALPVSATFDQTSFSASVSIGDGSNTITVTASVDGNADESDSVEVVYPFVALTTFENASLVLGQTSYTANGTSVAEPIAIEHPYGHAAWAGENLYLPSSDGNRVLGYHGFPSRDGEPGDFALGQPDLLTTAAGVGPGGMEYPQSIEVDGTRLYVLDWSASRILGWNTPPTTSGVPADFVIGQVDLESRVTGCSRDRTNSPDEFTIAGGRLFVSDRDAHRVLIWNTVPTTSGALPDVVLGQSDFDHCTADDDDQNGVADATPSARTLDNPIGLWSDGTKLFVTDRANHRVLVWNAIPTSSFTPADWVLGQPDFASQSVGYAADRMAYPSSVAGNGNQLAIAEAGNHRVLVWNTVPSAPTAPDVVLGQSDFTHHRENDDDQDDVGGPPSARVLWHPDGVAFIRDTIVVSDDYNHRVVVFGRLPCPTGEYEPASARGTCLDDPCQPDPCTAGTLCRNDTGAAVCE